MVPLVVAERRSSFRVTDGSRWVVPDTWLRDLVIAVGVGLAVLGFVVYAVFALGRQAESTGGVEGIIVAKEFVAQPEMQVTVGKGGVSSRQIAGEYILRVRVPSEQDKVYRVYVDWKEYEARREGDHYYFVRSR